MAKIAHLTRGMLGVAAVVASVVFAVGLPAMASTTSTAAGLAATTVIPCPLADTPPASGPVTSAVPVPTCPPPCPPPCPVPSTPQPSGAIVCPMTSGASAAPNVIPICPSPSPSPSPCPPPCPTLPTPQPAGAGVCPLPDTSIVPLCTVSAFHNLATTFCLDTDDGAVPTVFSVACNDSRSQQWVFTRSNTTSTLRDLASGRCLTSNATGDAFAVSCTSPPTATPLHQWFVTQSGGPIIDVVTGRCLASPLVPGPSRIPVDTSQCNGTPAQNWTHT